MRILIADDSRVERWQVRRIVESAGHEIIHESANGLDALDHIRLLKPDVAILDVVMPQMTGDQVLLALADEPHPALVVGSKNSQASLQAIVDSVGATLCVKPYHPQRLLSCIEVANGKRR